MANLDTENKRRAGANFYLFIIHPLADGTIDDNDREQATGFYSGIDPGLPDVILRRLKGLLMRVYP